MFCMFPAAVGCMFILYFALLTSGDSATKAPQTNSEYVFFFLFTKNGPPSHVLISDLLPFLCNSLSLSVDQVSLLIFA